MNQTTQSKRDMLFERKKQMRMGMGNSMPKGGDPGLPLQGGFGPEAGAFGKVGPPMDPFGNDGGQGRLNNVPAGPPSNFEA